VDVSLNYNFLGGGFKYFLFSTLLGEMIKFDSYFSDGLKPPTSFEFKDLVHDPMKQPFQFVNVSADLFSTQLPDFPTV